MPLDPEKLARVDAAFQRAAGGGAARADAGFEEGKHPRASDGKFGSGGSGKIHESARGHPTNTHAPMKRKSGEDINDYMSRALAERDARASVAKNKVQTGNRTSWR